MILSRKVTKQDAADTVHGEKTSTELGIHISNASTKLWPYTATTFLLGLFSMQKPWLQEWKIVSLAPQGGNPECLQPDILEKLDW